MRPHGLVTDLLFLMIVSVNVAARPTSLQTTGILGGPSDGASPTVLVSRSPLPGVSGSYLKPVTVPTIATVESTPEHHPSHQSPMFHFPQLPDDYQTTPGSPSEALRLVDQLLLTQHFQYLIQQLQEVHQLNDAAVNEEGLKIHPDTKIIAHSLLYHYNLVKRERSTYPVSYVPEESPTWSSGDIRAGMSQAPRTLDKELCYMPTRDQQNGENTGTVSTLFSEIKRTKLFQHLYQITKEDKLDASVRQLFSDIYSDVGQVMGCLAVLCNRFYPGQSIHFIMPTV